MLLKQTIGKFDRIVIKFVSDISFHVLLLVRPIKKPTSSFVHSDLGPNVELPKFI